ncbi:MAG: potassium transporter TrkA [Actinomycetota bacterium]|nr:potassium transporter TrkA [Actinomycetota bacterium]
MREVTETQLPGVGVRHEFTTSNGERLGVVSLRGGRRQIILYDREDSDACSTLLHLDADDSQTLAELLGAVHIAEALVALQRVQGIALDWFDIPARSHAIGTTIGQGRYRTRTGASIVAVVRAGATLPAPGPDFAFAADDTAVAVGTPEGLARLRELLQG